VIEREPFNAFAVTCSVIVFTPIAVNGVLMVRAVPTVLPFTCHVNDPAFIPLLCQRHPVQFDDFSFGEDRAFVRRQDDGLRRLRHQHEGRRRGEGRVKLSLARHAHATPYSWPSRNPRPHQAVADDVRIDHHPVRAVVRRVIEAELQRVTVEVAGRPRDRDRTGGVERAAVGRGDADVGALGLTVFDHNTLLS